MKIYMPAPPPSSVLRAYRENAMTVASCQKKVDAAHTKDPDRLSQSTRTAEMRLAKAKTDLRIEQSHVDDATPLYWNRRGQPVKIVSSAEGEPFPLIIEFVDGFRGIAEPSSVVDAPIARDKD